MTLQTFKHVEDYIEYIAGYRTDNSNLWGGILLKMTDTANTISLARYDVNVIESLSNQSVANLGYTDRQAQLAKTLVLKYERQLAKQGVSVEPVKEFAVFRTPIRTIDRSTRLWIENDIINLRFPYKENLIDSIRKMAKESRGFLTFDKTSRIWKSALTEHNLNFLYVFAAYNQFEIDPEVEQLMQKILTLEHTPYKIELKMSKSGLEIANAETSLLDYVNSHCGGFSDANLLHLIDWSSILGYTIDKDIEEVVIQHHGTRFYSLCANNVLSLKKTNLKEDVIKEIVDYARTINRLPIYVHDPDMVNDILDKFKQHFSEEEIINLDVDQNITDQHKLVCTTKIPRKSLVDKIPLFVSGATMLFGGDRQLWVQQSEKVVYLNNEVYNPKYKGTKICRLD